MRDLPSTARGLLLGAAVPLLVAIGLPAAAEGVSAPEGGLAAAAAPSTSSKASEAPVTGRARSASLDPRLDKAAPSPLVIELFTAQGCVSCPPADAYLASLTQKEGLLPLALHVDYWDYIGWEDNFARNEFTERQKAYARAIGSNTIYTPQFIVAGQDRVEGFVLDEIEARIAEHARARGPIRMRALRDDGNLTILADSEHPLAAPVRVQLVRYIPEQSVEILRGENAGKNITYRNIVTQWEVLGDWPGQEPLEVEVPIAGSDPAVVIMQETGPGEILAAVRVE